MFLCDWLIFVGNLSSNMFSTCCITSWRECYTDGILMHFRFTSRFVDVQHVLCDILMWVLHWWDYHALHICLNIFPVQVSHKGARQKVLVVCNLLCKMSGTCYVTSWSMNFSLWTKCSIKNLVRKHVLIHLFHITYSIVFLDCDCCSGFSFSLWEIMEKRGVMMCMGYSVYVKLLLQWMFWCVYGVVCSHVGESGHTFGLKLWACMFMSMCELIFMCVYGLWCLMCSNHRTYVLLLLLLFALFYFVVCLWCSICVIFEYLPIHIS